MSYFQTTEATVQAEFYHWGRVLGLVSELEKTTPAGRVDLAILSNDRTRLLCIVECKKPRGYPMGTSSQINRYKRLGVPVYGLCQFERARGLVETILAKNYEGIPLSEVLSMPKIKRIRWRQTLKGSNGRRFKIDPELNYRQQAW